MSNNQDKTFKSLTRHCHTLFENVQKTKTNSYASLVYGKLKEYKNFAEKCGRTYIANKINHYMEMIHNTYNIYPSIEAEGIEHSKHLIQKGEV